MQLAWARLRDAASFAWILLLMARVSEGPKTLLECDHAALFNANEMEWVTGRGSMSQKNMILIRLDSQFSLDFHMEDKFQECWSFLLGKTCIPLSIQSPCNTSSQYVIPFHTLFIAVWHGHSFCIKFAYFWPRRPATPLFKTKLCLACLLRRSVLPICNSSFRYNCDDMEEHPFFLSLQRRRPFQGI